MSPLAWLKRVFVPEPREDDGEIGDQDFGEGPSFTWNEHMRIVTALLIVLISAGVMWWILI